jgi:phospholipid/cholesterol/gamma-HCH transport system ATP-binding protein
MSSRLSLAGIVFQFGAERLLDNLNFSVDPGGMLTICGPSGSGKSILLEIAAGLVEPHSGCVTWRGRNISQLSVGDLAIERQTMGFLFQRQALISNYTLFENIALPLRYHQNLSEDELRRRVMARMDFFGIASLTKCLPEQISQGKARLAGFARAIIMEPDLLLLDEPLSGLSNQQVEKIEQAIGEMRQQREVTVIVASHSPARAQRLGCPVVMVGEEE